MMTSKMVTYSKKFDLDGVALLEALPGRLVFVNLKTVDVRAIGPSQTGMVGCDEVSYFV